MAQGKPRMGRIAYLNVLPVYHALETGLVPHGYELVYGPPAALNAMMETGDLAVSSISCVEYARRPERYWIVPDISIASNGEVMSVLLLSRVPVPELAGGTVLVSGETHTSVLLLRLLLKDYLKMPMTFAAGSVTDRVESGNAPEAALVIGDEALRLRRHPAFPHVWDLGRAWNAWTTLPFVFGLWVVSREAATRRNLAEDPAKVLRAGREWGAANTDAVLDAAVAKHAMPREAFSRYFGECLSYTLGEREQEGLRLFYQRLAAAGEITKAPDLAFWPGL